MINEQENFNASRQFQAYYDETLRHVGTHAPAPALGQTVNDYRRETLRQLKRTFLPKAHDLYQVQYRALQADALGAIEPQLLQAVVKEATNPAHVPVGELKKIERRDEFGKLAYIDFIGQDCFVKQMGRPGRRVIKFMSPADPHGRAIREFA